MINTFFYYSTIRKIAIAFADLFNNIKTQNSDNELYTVPIYMTTESKLMFRYRYPEKAKKKIFLPVLGFVINAPEHDKDRQKNKLNKLYQQSTESGNNSYAQIYQPTPYNISITLSLWAKYLEEFYQIVEQIAVNFKPHINTSIKLINEDSMTIIKDMPIILDNINFDLEYELNEDQERGLKATFNFTLKAELYPYIHENQKKIETIITDYNNYDNDELLESITLE